MSIQGLRVLVVDDNRSAAEAIGMLLEREGHTPVVCFDGQAALDQLAEQPFDLVLTDLRMEPVDGMEVVRAARALSPPVETIVFTAFGSVEAAVEAMRLGATDFLSKPVPGDQLVERVRRLASGKAQPRPGEIVGDSPATTRLREQAESIRKVRSTVLITGEVGTGRKHLAGWLHRNGPDNELPYLRLRPGTPVDEATLREAGTVVASNFDDWDEDSQLELLRRLELLEVGEPPRVIATASPEVEMKVAEGAIRPELYFRLAVLVVGLVPLRERPTDIGPLMRHFLTSFADTLDRTPPSLSENHLDRLKAHAWPGNVRELENLAERAVVIGPEAFDIQVTPAPTPTPSLPKLTEGFNLSQHLEEIERTLLVRAIEQTDGDRPEMGRLLGLERNTLRYKLNKYSLLD